MKKEQYSISKDNFEQCLKCTVCTVYCPVSSVNPLYPGPKQAGPDGERMRLKDKAFFDETLKMCLNCKRCEVACPSGVKIGDIIQRARMEYGPKKVKFRDMMLANTDFVGTMASLVAPVANFALGMKPVKLVMDKVMAIDHHRTFPKYSGLKFETWYKRKAAASQSQYKNQVSYFHGCYVNYNYPKLGQDLVKVMNALGYGVNLLEKEKCCGVALMSNGLTAQATKQAKQNMESIRKAGNMVLTTSSTCTFTMRDEYPHLLEVKNDDVRDNITLATRFIYRLIEDGKVKIAFRKDYKARIAYQTACHMEKMGWKIYSISLLKMIPGVDLVELDSQCCGIGGTYGFKKENYETSQKIGSSLFKQIEESGVDFVATDCETCKWQVEMSTSKSVMNPISVLADAIDVEETIKLNNK